jgi:hypothetical protein
MKKLGLALLTTAALSVVAATSAEARGFGGFHRGFGGFHRGFGGFGAGLFAGSVLGATGAFAYGYPYDYGYPPYYGYPAYGYYPYSFPAYGYYPFSYPAQEVVVVRRPRRIVHAHRLHRAAIASPHLFRRVHARFTPVHRVGMAHAR